MTTNNTKELYRKVDFNSSTDRYHISELYLDLDTLDLITVTYKSDDETIGYDLKRKNHGHMKDYMHRLKPEERKAVEEWLDSKLRQDKAQWIIRFLEKNKPLVKRREVYNVEAMLEDMEYYTNLTRRANKFWEVINA